MTSAEKLAEICHEANRAYCKVVGDHVQGHWDEIDDDMKASARGGVEAILKNPETTAQESHDHWMAIKLEQGWTYGAERNDELKLHPSLVPYDQLSTSEQYKDTLFRAIVQSYINFMAS